MEFGIGTTTHVSIVPSKVRYDLIISRLKFNKRDYLNKINTNSCSMFYGVSNFRLGLLFFKLINQLVEEQLHLFLFYVIKQGGR